MNKIKMVQIGTGKMSVYTMKYAQNKGCEIVGAFDINPKVIGKDIGTIMNTNEVGIKVSDIKNLETELMRLKPDIAVITTMSLLNDCKDVLLTCARCGVNAITTCEEAFDSYNSNPKLTKEIDILAKKNNCTITGSGYQDIFWGNLISAIAGATYKITEIKGSSSYNVEDYGIALAKAHGAGLSMSNFDKEVAVVDKISDEEREKLINNGTYLPSYMWNVNGWLCKKLGLHVKRQSQVTIPTTYKEDIYSETLEMTIKSGDATGMSAIVKTETMEGITIESECIGKVYSKDDYDKNEWTIHGEPETTITVARPDTVKLTCATIINRIPDVINAKPGFILTCEMDELKYRVNNLEKYIK